MAAWLVSSERYGGGDLELGARHVVDGYFDGRSELRKLRWPWRFLAEDPAKYAALGRGEQDTTEEERLREEILALEQKQAECHQGMHGGLGSLAEVRTATERARAQLAAARSGRSA